MLALGFFPGPVLDVLTPIADSSAPLVQTVAADNTTAMAVEGSAK